MSNKHHNYSRYSAPAPVEEIEVVGNVNDNTEVVEDTADKPQKCGVVTDCVQLNVRKNPNKTAEVVCKIDCLTEVMIDEAESTEDFYHIYTEAGIDGYCMKKFIAVQ